MTDFGERRHETCRFGVLTEAWVIREDGTQYPTVGPLCTWTPEVAPPALLRLWGGMIEPNSDCVRCPIWAEVEDAR